MSSKIHDFTIVCDKKQMYSDFFFWIIKDYRPIKILEQYTHAK